MKTIRRALALGQHRALRPVSRRRRLAWLAVVPAFALLTSCEPSPRPDLTLGAFTASRSASGTLTVKVFARNIGARGTSGVRVRFSEGSRIIGTGAPMTMPPDDIRVVTLSGTTISTGSHTLTAVIDPGGAIAESNEANNRITKTFTL